MLVQAIHGGGNGDNDDHSSNNDIKEHQQPQQHQEKSTTAPKDFIQPPKVDKSEVAEKPKEAANAANASTSGSSGGITGWLRGAFMKKEDQEKVAKQGKGLEAYYDKDLKRWVFPDDPNSATPIPELAPPPTFGSNNNSDPNTVTGASVGGIPSDPPSKGNNGTDDPMAALMAPPSYRMNNRKKVTSRYASVGFALSEDSTGDDGGSNGATMPGNFGPPPIGNSGAPPTVMSFGKK